MFEYYLIVQWIPITFRPPSSITMNDICAYTAAYIFMYDEEDSNGLVNHIYIISQFSSSIMWLMICGCILLCFVLTRF